MFAINKRLIHGKKDETAKESFIRDDKTSHSDKYRGRKIKVNGNKVSNVRTVENNVFSLFPFQLDFLQKTFHRNDPVLDQSLPSHMP